MMANAALRKNRCVAVGDGIGSCAGSIFGKQVFQIGFGEVFGEAFFAEDVGDVLGFAHL
jgi:hypothetical protein